MAIQPKEFIAARVAAPSNPIQQPILLIRGASLNWHHQTHTQVVVSLQVQKRLQRATMMIRGAPTDATNMSWSGDLLDEGRSDVAMALLF